VLTGISPEETNTETYVNDVLVSNNHLDCSGTALERPHALLSSYGTHPFERTHDFRSKLLYRVQSCDDYLYTRKDATHFDRIAP